MESFEAYVRARNPALSRIAYLLTGDHHLAEDLVQQTLLRVAGAWPRIIRRGDPDPYVRRALYHQHISWWRHRRGAVEVPGATPDRSAEDHSETVAATVAMQQALARLAPPEPRDRWSTSTPITNSPGRALGTIRGGWPSGT